MTGPAQNDHAGAHGLYSLIDGSLSVVISTDFTLDGKAITGFRYGEGGFDGNNVGFVATFDDFSQGVYVANPIPDPCAVFLLGCWEWAGFLRQSAWLRILYVLTGLLLAALAAVAHQQMGGEFFAVVLYAAIAWWLLVAAVLIFHEIRYGLSLTAIAGYCCLLPAWGSLLMLLTDARGVWLLVWLKLLE